MVGWVGGVEEWRIKLSQLSTRLKLKLKLSLAICEFPLKHIVSLALLLVSNVHNFMVSDLSVMILV